MVTNKLLPLLMIAIGLTVGCAAGASAPLSAEPSRIPTQTGEADAPGTPADRATPHVSFTTAQPGRPAAMPTPDVESAVARAVADLATRLGVDPELIRIVRVSTDEFPIQNLGCPFPQGKEPEPVQPAFVTGREIVLAVGDRRYTYRASGSTLIFCEEKP